jgi:DNA-binding MarR family transcriptional regulator
MADETLLLDNQLCFALYRASRALTRAYAPLLEPLGITYPQYVVFLSLWEKDGRPLNELGTCLALDSGTLTPLVKRLEQAGFVNRARDRADERVVRIFLTPAGKALKQKAKRIPIAIAEKTGFANKLGELVELRDELNALTDRIEATS